jgi:NAD-dependent dihydropyrimidine dehydrogenase PreA subunit
MTIAIDSQKCDGCGLCVQSCPVDVLRLNAATGKAEAPYERDCHVCCLCEDDCPTHAIAIDYAIANARQKSIYDLLNIPDPAEPFVAPIIIRD